MFVMALTMSAQRHTDKLDRGLVAVPGSSGGYFVSWRVFGEEYYGVTYNLYANGTKIASNLKVSSYTHSGGNANTKYQVAPVVNGIEQAKCDEVTPWAGSAGQGMLTIPVAAPTDRDGNDASAYYTLNDVSIGDLDGDGGVPGLANASEVINYTRQLLRRRYSVEQIQMLWGGNFLRVMEKVQKV